MQDQDLALDDSANIFGMMAAVRHVAAQMAKREAHRKWRSACVQIMSATRRAEELLQPFLLVDVCPEESDVFTHHTVSFHLQAPVEGSVTAVTWSVTEETRTQGAPEAFNFPEVIPGGETEAKMQALEHHLLELQNAHKDSDHSDIAATLHRLGNLSQQAGDLNQAKQYFDETLRMKRSLHGDGDHREIALTLHELGSLSLETGDLKQAKQYLEESLRMNRSLHGMIRDVTATLHALGNLSRRAGDLKQAKTYFDECLRMGPLLTWRQGSPWDRCDAACAGQLESEGWRSQSSEAVLRWVLANEALLAWRQGSPWDCCNAAWAGQLEFWLWRSQSSEAVLQWVLANESLLAWWPGSPWHCCNAACAGQLESAGWRSQTSEAVHGRVLENDSLLAWRQGWPRHCCNAAWPGELQSAGWRYQTSEANTWKSPWEWSAPCMETGLTVKLLQRCMNWANCLCRLEISSGPSCTLSSTA